MCMTVKYLSVNKDIKPMPLAVAQFSNTQLTLSVTSVNC